jgi:hypothetical protein
MYTSSSKSAQKPMQFPIKPVLLTAVVVSVAFVASYFTLLRSKDAATPIFDSQRSIAHNSLFQSRVTITSAYVMQTKVAVLMAGESSQGLNAKLEALQSDIGTVGEYGISKQAVDVFWKDYGSLRSDEHLQKIDWLKRTRIEVYAALSGAAFIQLYRQDFSPDRLDRLNAAVEMLKSYHSQMIDSEPQEAVKLQIDSALFLVQSQIRDFTKGVL